MERYRLIVAPGKFAVVKSNICPTSEASRANRLVLRLTSNFPGATIRLIVPRRKHSIRLSFLFTKFSSPHQFKTHIVFIYFQPFKVYMTQKNFLLIWKAFQKTEKNFCVIYTLKLFKMKAVTGKCKKATRKKTKTQLIQLISIGYFL